MPDGHRYGVDHGLCFHVEHKLRTVLWGWSGEPLSDDELAALGQLSGAVTGAAYDPLAEHLTDAELEALVARLDRLVARGTLPHPRGDYPAIPWPPF